MDRLEIPAAEHRARLSALREALETAGFGAMCVFGPVRIGYLTGFHFIPTERPIVLVVPVDGEPALLVPRLEGEHVAHQGAVVETVHTYPEYPGGGSGKHPMLHLKDLVAQVAPGARLVADLAGYGDRWGYRGPTLEAVMNRPVALRLELVDDRRMVKSPAEVALVREACRWGDRAHRAMQDRMVAGASELEVSQAASLETTAAMLRELGGRYVPKSREGRPANAMFIRGTNTANPHGNHAGGGLRMGDTIVTGAYGVVGAYESELERTMFFGAPTGEQERYFGAMLVAQDAAFTAIRPGRTCAEVEADVVRFIAADLGMAAYTRHHTGHSFGLEGHEYPFLDLDDHTEVRPGMILSVEPGIYVPGLGGFRHSDTVVVTESGCERLSLYPRELAELVVEA